MRAIAPLLLASVALLTACDQPASPAQQLPPPGMAGVGSAGTPGGNPVALPGAGLQVTPPSGTADPGTQLPPGHPPITGGTMPAPPLGSGKPMDHSNAPDAPAGAAMAGGADGAVTFTGTVAETMDVTEYTYMRVKGTGGADTWVAVGKTPVAVGDIVTVNQSIVMNNFPSKSLNRTFDKLVMGVMVGAPKKP